MKTGVMKRTVLARLSMALLLLGGCAATTTPISTPLTGSNAPGSLLGTAPVVEIAYVNGKVWQKSSTGLWRYYSSGTWNPAGGTSVSPLP